MRISTLLAFMSIFVLNSSIDAGEEPFERVSITTEDGWKLWALLSKGIKKDSKGVIFVHEFAKDSRVWYITALKTLNAGFTVLTPDLRGHGRSILKNGMRVELSKKDLGMMEKDLNLWVKFLLRRAPKMKDVALIGAGIGANIVFNYAASHPEIKKVILLSPGLELNGIGIEKSLSLFKSRPLLIIFSREDSYSVKTALYMEAVIKGSVELKIIDGSSRGTDMIRQNIGTETELLLWLKSGRGEESAPWLKNPKPIIEKK